MRQLLLMLMVVSTFLLGVLSEEAAAQDRLPLSDLCGLQEKLGQGENRIVCVAGIYMASGVEGPTYVVDPRCSIRATVVEFNLKSHKNSRKLHNLVFKSTDKSGVIGDGDPVFIIFEGEIFGPQMPDPKLPEYFRKNYHPGWDANNYKTKLVVHSILDVRQLSLDHPCAATKDDKWPCYQHTAPTMTP